MTIELNFQIEKKVKKKEQKIREYFKMTQNRPAFQIIINYIKDGFIS